MVIIKKIQEESDKSGERTQKAFASDHQCLICGKPNPQTICQRCQDLIQAEAIEKKRKIEKETG